MTEEKKKLLSIEEHTTLVYNRVDKKPITGIACPECDSELVFTTVVVLNTTETEMQVLIY